MTTGLKFDYNMEIFPLEIKTSSVLGSDERLEVSFYSDASWRGGVKVYFYSIPKYRLDQCTSFTDNSLKSDFQNDLPSETDKIWRIAVKERADGVNVQIHCNDVEVLSLAISESNCPDFRRTYWKKDINEIRFSSSDKASDYYKHYTGNLSSRLLITSHKSPQIRLQLDRKNSIACLKFGIPRRKKIEF